MFRMQILKIFKYILLAFSVLRNRMADPGGGGNLTCPWYGAVPSFRVPFHDRLRIYGYGPQQFQHFPNLWVCFYVKLHLLVSIFRISGFMGMMLRNRIYGYTFQKFVRIYGLYFYDLNDTTPYLGNSSDPPPPRLGDIGKTMPKPFVS